MGERSSVKTPVKCRGRKGNRKRKKGEKKKEVPFVSAVYSLRYLSLYIFFFFNLV